MSEIKKNRGLLEAAAKAAGDLVDGPVGPVWNPLNDDGDALRLAVKLGAIVGTYANFSTVDLLSPNERIKTVTVWHHETNGDSCAATRLAIVRAAAEIALNSHTAEQL